MFTVNLSDKIPQISPIDHIFASFCCLNFLKKINIVLLSILLRAFQTEMFFIHFFGGLAMKNTTWRQTKNGKYVPCVPGIVQFTPNPYSSQKYLDSEGNIYRGITTPNGGLVGHKLNFSSGAN